MKSLFAFHAHSMRRSTFYSDVDFFPVNAFVIGPHARSDPGNQASYSYSCDRPTTQICRQAQCAISICWYRTLKNGWCDVEAGCVCVGESRKLSGETSLYGMMLSMDFDILNHPGVTHECNRQTDGRTDRQMNRHSASNASLNYFARPKSVVRLVSRWK